MKIVDKFWKKSHSRPASAGKVIPSEKKSKSYDDFLKRKSSHSYRTDTAKEAQKTRNFWRVFVGGTWAVTKFFFDMGLIVSVAFGIVFFYAYHNSVDATALTKRKVSETTTIYDRTGEHILYKLYGEENRKLVKHDQLPDNLRNATVAIEDERFYSHVGIDVVGIMRALRENYQTNSIAQGASTITQQVARNALLTREKTLVRKFKEAVLAIKIERTYTKDQILDLYLNLVPYGSNTYGAEVAAQTYFAKNAKDLSLDEAAMIAGIPKATTTYSPYSGDSAAIETRQQLVLQKMGELGMYSSDEINAALGEDTLKKVQEFREDIEAPHFVFYVREELEKIYDKEALEQGGFKIYTTLDYDMQKRAEVMVSEYAAELPQYGASNASLIAVNPKNGEVMAMVGSVDYFDRENDGNVNVALMDRQPGSSFKPIIYAAAFEKGYQPETLLYDVRTNFGPDGTGKNYIPNNFDGRNNGLVSMRKAIQGSLNIPAVKTQYLVGKDSAIDFAESLGITSFEQRNRFGLSLVLGGGEVKLLELVGAYSVFANDGLRVPVHGVTRIIDPIGKEYTVQRDQEQVMDPQNARKINNVLSDYKAREYVFGRTNVLSIPDEIVAAKTGTTQSFRDALTLGYTPSIAVGVWAGNNDATYMRANSLGSRVAAPLWRKFMEAEIQNMPKESFPEYQKVESKLPMITGNRPRGETGGDVKYFKIASGKQISKTKADDLDDDEVRIERTGGKVHSLLHYINREDPLNESLPPNLNDDMYFRWERSLGFR